MWQIFRKYISLRNFGFIAAEFGLFAICPFVIKGAVWVLQLSGILSPDAAPEPFYRLVIKACFVAGVFVICLHLFDVYDFKTPASKEEVAIRIIKATVSAFVVVIVTYWFFVPL